MAAAMNGMALHGGFIPYGGTFLVFSDYARGAIRLSALMGMRVIYVLTHDSIGLGEDGPTHQPVETLAALRAIPNLLVFRPGRRGGDGGSLGRRRSAEPARPVGPGPDRVRTCRPLRAEPPGENLTAKGAYVLRETDGPRDVTLLATGSEVELAVAAAETAGRRRHEGRRGLHALLGAVRAPERRLPRAVLGTAPRVGVEAALRFGWDRWLGDNGAFVGMTRLRRLGAGAANFTSISASRRKPSSARPGSCWHYQLRMQG